MADAVGVVRRAILSVHDKRGLGELGRALAARDVELLASGGTARALAEAGVPVTPVEQHTGAPELLDGRVKTMHPRVHAGILADRRNAAHLAQLAEHALVPIDLVVCNLYPFAEALARGAERAEQIENIDIGGPSLLRAAAKNADGGVTVLCDPDDYGALLARLAEDGLVPLALRRALAAKAFAHTAAYDATVAAWFAGEERRFPPALPGFSAPVELRYGENPHQRGFLYAAETETSGVARGRLLAGKQLSYNNTIDLDAAWRAVRGLDGVGCAIIKHTNPCGMAEAESQAEAFARALAGDPLSAFGSVIGFNQPLSGAAAQAIRDSKLFVECIVAPAFSPEALALLQRRENLRLLVAPPGPAAPPWHAHRIGGGMLVEETDPGIAPPSEWRCVTRRQPEAGWLEELAFALRVVAALKSNAIAVTRQRALLGIGTGQTSRVDATLQALAKAGVRARGAFLASDAFFPFDDSVRPAAAAGIVAVVEPGGSKRDAEVIAACDELGLCMMFCGRRHFRH